MEQSQIKDIQVSHLKRYAAILSNGLNIKNIHATQSKTVVNGTVHFHAFR
jgi:hypothetical protein